MRRVRAALSVVSPIVVLALALTGCAGEESPGQGADAGASTAAESSSAQSSSAQGGEASGQQYPDVQSVELTATGERTYDVAVTISSPYDTPERYADGWRVLDPDGNELGMHELTHDHASEQPFTRTQYDLEIPAGISEVTVEGRDLENGFGGKTATVSVPD